MTRNHQAAGILLALLAAVPCMVLLAQDPAPAPDPREVMAVTIDKSVLGDGDPEALKDLLEIGQVIIIDRHARGVPWLASAGTLIGAPLDVSYRAITDFEGLPDFMPQTDAVRYRELSPNFYEVDIDVVIRLVFIPIRVDVHNYQYNRPPDRTDWAGRYPDQSLNPGYWQLIPVDDGRTMGFYTLYTEVKQGFAHRLFQLEPTLELLAAMSTGTMAARATAEHAENLYCQAGGAVTEKKPSGKKVLDVLRDSPDTVRRLASKGRLLVLEEKDLVWANVAMVLDYPPEKVWEWLVNVEDQAEIDPRVTVKVTQRDERSMSADFEMEIYLILSVDLDYTLQYELDGPNRISWKTKPGSGNIEGLEGSWDLIPLDDGRRTLALLRTTVDIRSQGLLMRAILGLEPTLELAIQASQSLLAADNLERCLASTEEERKAMLEERKKAIKDVGDLDLPGPTEHVLEPK